MDRDKVFVHMCGQMKCVFDDCQKKKWDSGYHTICWEGESRSNQEESRKKEEKEETWEKWWDKKIGNEKERGHKDMRQERKTERWKEDRWKENKKTAERRSTGNETRANDWKQEETGKERKKDGEDEARSAEEAVSLCHNRWAKLRPLYQVT